MHRLVASDDEREAASLQQQSAREGAEAVGRCSMGRQVCVSGEVRSTRVDSRGGSPVLEVELFDGTGTMSVLFLGRRQVAGITAGRGLTVHGRVSRSEGRPTMFNPAYELVADAAAS
jgi:DNA/RNA endonuclease YhcR with UshA esterase domain